MNDAPQRTAIITGVGPGTGSALVRDFASAGYRVAMLARSAPRLETLAAQEPNALAYPCDVANPDGLADTLTGIVSDLGGPPDVVVHNAVGGAFGDFLAIDPQTLANNFQINTMALLHLARHLAPGMIERGSGAIVATGNTSAYRGKAGFAGFAPTKAAQRILLESMARRLGPDGVHVAYVAIDAVIDLEWTRERFADKPDDFFCKPADIAAEVRRISEQPRSAWSFESVIRPFGEPW
ncbi:MAG: SDR family NAD(P)-dependent oxidoreductase [Pseudomonadota bacterium]